MTAKKILVTGGSGQVGSSLSAIKWPDTIQAVFPPRSALNLAEADNVANFIHKGGFSAIINAGAYTAVDKAESDLLNAFKVNALGPAAIAKAAKELDIPLVHISTDYVFNGCKEGRYLETDAIDPQSVYGASKAAGELAIQSSGCRHVILRTSWVFSETGHNFVKTMLRLADRPELAVVNDQTGCPTTSIDIAITARQVALRLIDENNAPTGIYNFCGEQSTTWHGFAAEIFDHMARRGMPVPKVASIPTSAYPTPARRPANSALSTDKILKDFGIEPCQWQCALPRIIDLILNEKEKATLQ